MTVPDLLVLWNTFGTLVDYNAIGFDTKRIMRKQKAQAFQFDRELLGEIYDTYQPSIYRSIYHKIGDIETARDLTADVFHRLLQAVQKGKGPSRDVKAWLYRTAHNIVVDHYRRQQFRRHDPLAKDLPTGEPGPDQVAENHVLQIPFAKPWPP